jgi:hypothetical protein
MLRFKLLILVLLITFSTTFASVELFSFHAFGVIDHSRLEWSTGHDGESFFAVGQVQSAGSFSEYEFVDTSPLDVNMDRTFFYRLKMIDRDGTFHYSDIQQVSLSFSAVQHTWGSIKAMFR